MKKKTKQLEMAVIAPEAVEAAESAHLTKEEYLAFRKERKEAGLEIDPETAEVRDAYMDVTDPYGVLLTLPEEFYAGTYHFARLPGGDWVWFPDLPAATRDALLGPPIDD